MQTVHFLQLLLIGLIAASVPLAYVWAERGGRGAYRKLVWVTLFLTFDLIMFGAFTRLTDSGLGCPDWPGCYGTSNPIAAHQQIKAAEAAQPTGPVTVQKAWIEMIHRYFAMAVGALIVALAAVAWKQRRESGRSPWPATGLLLLVCVQGAFGAWTVTLKLMPLIVTIHLMLAMGLLSALAWHGARVGELKILTNPTQARDHNARLLKLASLTLALVVMQIALGGWVSTNYAVLACPDFPLCNGALVPGNADFASGFELLRPLGVLADGSHLPVEALVAIHWVHRAFALIVTAAVITLATMLLRAPAARGEAKPLARWLLALLCLQIITGISNVVFTWPLAVAVAHNGGAAALVLVLTLLLARLVPVSAAVSAANSAAGRIGENTLTGLATGAAQQRVSASSSDGVAA
jgi:heme a synthase